jgi:hypothetical protein
LSDATFESTVNATEKTAWQAFGHVVRKFVGNKDPNDTSIFNNMPNAIKVILKNICNTINIIITVLQRTHT